MSQNNWNLPLPMAKNLDEMHTYTKVIVCESTEKGTDKRLLETLIYKHSLLQANSFYIKTVPPTGSFDEVKGFLTNTLSKQEYIVSKKIDSVLVIVDADEDPQVRFQEIKKSFDTSVFSVQSSINSTLPFTKDKIRVGIYLFPDRQNPGSLETLALGALRHQNLGSKLKCVNNYINCVLTVDGPMTENNKSKSKFRIFMASPEPDRYVHGIMEHIDFNSKKFELLKDFIRQVHNVP